MTRNTRKLLNRYEVIFGKKPITWVKSGLVKLDDYLVEWGDEVLTLEEKWAKNADVSGGNFPKSGDLFSMSGLDVLSVSDMTEKEILAASKKALKKMLKLAGAYLNEKIEEGIKSRLDRWTKHALKYAKQPKKSVTYQALPVKIHQGNGSFGLIFDVYVPYDGYGNKTEFGFSFETNDFYIPGALFENGEDGHLELQNSHIVLFTKRSNWYMIDKKLEAFLD